MLSGELQCGRSKNVQIANMQFGRLTAVKYQGKGKWMCVCVCGKNTIVNSNALTKGKSKSCGCGKSQAVSKSLTKHGHCRSSGRTKEYATWAKMIGRCHCSTDKAYARYGMRGITVCDEWKVNFLAFLEHIGPCPASSMSIDRIDNNRGYEPGNVRWATKLQQSTNKSVNRHIEHAGIRMTIAEWADYIRMPRKTLYHRINRGLSVDKSLVHVDYRK